MAGMIVKQPNGLYCRFSSVVDCPTHCNMTFDDYVNVIMERGYQRWKAEEEARDVIENYLHPFSEMISLFMPINMTEEKFKTLLDEMGYKGD